MEPGYYAVTLDDPKVRVELTSTERTGLHRYTFPKSEDAWLILDLSHSYLTDGGSSVYSAELAAACGRYADRGSRDPGVGTRPACVLHVAGFQAADQGRAVQR